MRIRLLAVALLLAPLLVAPPFTLEAGAASPYTVDVTYDAADDTPGDGVCDDGTGHCTLRAAVQEANQDPADDVIVLPSAGALALTLGGSEPAAGDDPETVGDLDVLASAGSTTITGNGATIDAGTLGDRALTAWDPAVGGAAGILSLTDLTITGGTATTVTLPAGPPAAAGGGLLVLGGGLALDGVSVTANTAALGGGVFAAAADVTITTSTLSANHATKSGGGIHTASGAELTIDHSTLSENSAEQLGAGLHNVASTASVTNSTFSGNAAEVRGGAISNAASLTVRFTTIAANKAPYGGTGLYTGFDNPAATTSIGASALVDDAASLNCEGPGTTTSVGVNVSHDGSCLGHASDVWADPMLLPLAANGGPTRTHAVSKWSAAVDLVPAGTLGCGTEVSDDQRGVARPGFTACEPGAYERGTTDPIELAVDTATDGTDSDPGDGTCATSGGDCTLRAAIQETNAWPTDDVVSFAPGVAGGTVTLSIADAHPFDDDDLAAEGDLDVTDTLLVEGAGTTVDADGIDTVIDHHVGSLTLRDLTVTGGYDHEVGGIRSTSTLLLDGTTVAGNAGSYGGVLSWGPLTMVDSVGSPGTELEFAL